MKIAMFTLALALTACGQTQSSSSALAGKTSSIVGHSYCRIVMGGGLGGPKKPRENCITFNDATTYTDNSPTFFGNPPRKGVYILQGLTLVTQYKTNNGQEAKALYSLSADYRTLTLFDGPAFTLKK